MSEEIKLVSCPFCGSQDVSPVEDQIDEASSEHWVHCEDCGAEGPYKFLPLGHPDEALTAWNTRAETSKEAMLKASNRALDDTLTMRNEELERLRAENAELFRKMKCLGAALLYAGPILNRCGVTADTMEGFHLQHLWRQAGVEWKCFLDSKDIQDAMSCIAKDQP